MMPCRLATTGNLVGTYAAGPDPNNPGINASFTMTATGLIQIDGVGVVAGAAVLFKDQTNPIQNGLYLCTTTGSTGVSTVFNRWSNFCTASLVNNFGLITVLEGDVNSLSNWVLSGIINAVGTDSINFSSVSNSNIITTPTSVTTATYNMTSSDQFLVCNRAGAITINLISTTGLGKGRRVIIKDDSGAAATNNITVTPTGANIDGASSYVINTNYGSVTLIYNGTQWNLI